MNSGEVPLVLVIDDDPDQLALVRLAALRAGGLRVMSAESVSEAFLQLDDREAARLSAPDLVLTDLRLPGISDCELLHLLRNRPELSRLPIVVLTSSAYTRDRQTARLAGADAFFEKPVHFGDLVEILRKLPALAARVASAERAEAKSSARPAMVEAGARGA